jgi:CRISPR-associated protein Cas5d
MSYGVRIRVHGDRACFSRPDGGGGRITYDVMPPMAARGILEAIHWRPAIRWMVDRIHVLAPLRFEESGEGGDALAPGVPERVLRDVDYVIEAHFELTERAGPGEGVGKHLDMFNRRLRRGQCFHPPCLGARDFPASFGPVAADMPTCPDELRGKRDLGAMVLDIDFSAGRRPRFFHACLIDGVLDVPVREALPQARPGHGEGEWDRQGPPRETAYGQSLGL